MDSAAVIDGCHNSLLSHSDVGRPALVLAIKVSECSPADGMCAAATNQGDVGTSDWQLAQKLHDFVRACNAQRSYPATNRYCAVTSTARHRSRGSRALGLK